MTRRKLRLYDPFDYVRVRAAVGRERAYRPPLRFPELEQWLYDRRDAGLADPMTQIRAGIAARRGR